MNKWVFLTGLIFSGFVSANTSASFSTADAFKQALGQFKPSDVLSGYTESPPQVYLNPTEKNDGLENQGLSVARQNDTTNQVVVQYNTRTKAINNPDSAEMRYAEKLIEGSDDVKEGGCYAQPPKCTTNLTTHHCTETLTYKKETCRDALMVNMKKTIHTGKRIAIGYYLSNPPFDLGRCRPNEIGCREVHVGPNCLAVSVSASLNGTPVSVSSDQTCSNLMLTIYTKFRPEVNWIDITVTEFTSEDVWHKQSCAALQDRVSKSACIYESGVPCLEANATKIIDGIPIQRACWGSTKEFQCFDHLESTCASFINNPSCKQTQSACVEQKQTLCSQYSQTFECAEQTCIPQPDICVQTLPCVNGECDNTHNEESHDMGEGVSRLGALAGVASDVAINQIDLGSPRIFAGESQECKKHMLGARNCCSNSGWADWVVHCPKSMQDIHRAKEEGRAVFLGEYDDGLFDSEKHFVYCIFPSKLAGIIQIEGRGQQLHIPFGEAKVPNCRGITPEELERIDFGALNMSPIEKELTARLTPPDLKESASLNQTHIERLHQEGQAHD